MSLNRSKHWIAGLLIASLLLVGCETATPGQGLPPSTVAQSVLQSPLAPPATVPALTPTPAPTPEPALTPAPAAAPVQLTVLHTNDNWGETEPCGWGSNPTGGFRRRATFVTEQRKNAEALLLLDTGDALVGSGKLGTATQGKAIIAGMSLMGYDAMALGPKEMSLGLDLLRQRIGEAGFPILSANVVLTGTERLVTEPYTILDVGGHAVGIIGLTRQAAAPAGFQVLDPQQALERYLPEVREKAGTVILLTNLEYNAALALAQAVPGIDLLVGALPSQFPTQSVRAPGANTLVVVADMATPGHSGRCVGVLSVTLGSDGSLTGESWSTRWIDKTIADDPAMQALLDKYR